ncbi:hypothetical protein FHS31_002307 [Sphingomonas vulcanisoli]|uniref:Uncharacterized protein n=1 Tax=Sphingomonas vulcanisoli TaxID=1658060 RepID=A0ABX0TT47_9SPHN|nr:hypothetical protein [Sphingomonas vulcanisoli]NIJ08686.1 hypothetical protein [Sphingomonas vulcanisoli]
MAVPKHKLDWQSDEAPRAPVVAGQMSARTLQRMLSEQSGLFAEPHVDRWSRRRQLTFIVSSATALWAALIITAHTLVVAIA